MRLNRRKTATVASTRAATVAAREAFEVDGIDTVDSVRDLGVDVSWDRRRQRTRGERRERAAQQAERLQRLPCGPVFRTRAAAALLVSAGTYGAAVDGLVPTSARAMRRGAKGIAPEAPIAKGSRNGFRFL